MNNINVYFFSYTTDDIPPAFFSEEIKILLPEQRQKRIERYRFPKDKLISTLAGLLIHYSYYMSSGDVELPEIKYGKCGKPYFISEKAPQFSLSHTCKKGRGVAAVAMSSEPVGIDTEFIRTANTGIADRFFTKAESDYIHRSENPDECFYRLWTRKEAFVKCSGEGIQHGFDTFSVIDDEAQRLFFTEKYQDFFISVYSDIPDKSIRSESVSVEKLESFCKMLLQKNQKKDR